MEEIAGHFEEEARRKRETKKAKKVKVNHHKKYQMQTRISNE